MTAAIELQDIRVAPIDLRVGDLLRTGHGAKRISALNFDQHGRVAYTLDTRDSFDSPWYADGMGWRYDDLDGTWAILRAA